MQRGLSHRHLLALVLALATLLAPLGVAARSAADPPGRAVLYFFWAEGCPHCAAAKVTLARLAQRHPDLEIRSFEVRRSADNQQRFAAMASAFGIEPTGVPAFFLGSQHWVGFSELITPRVLEQAVSRCLAQGCPDAGADIVPRGGSPPPREVIDLPLLGEVDAAGRSLVLSTILIAAVDGVNPCSLWVLSILLALTLRTGSRRTTAVTGLVFIFVTGLVYALFIGGLFTVFAVLRFAPAVRILVAILAVAFAVINIKDFFWFKRGVSLSIPETSKPGIYDRMRRVLASAQSLPALVASTVVLAAGVSFVELACTAGFPVLWTNIVADRDVSPLAFGALLGLYMLVYQLDELVIFGVAVATMRATKLQERQGRTLKLLSGMLMFSLAIVMLIAPSMLNDVGTSLLVFASAAGATGLILLVDRLIRPPRRANRAASGRPRN
ncbi:MAG: thioredoxin family protein [Mycobacterium sp.]|nr:thioredoxin family protein [Mycobacterium sp.]